MKISYTNTAAVSGIIITLPAISQAAAPSLQSLIVGTNDFINTVLIPAVLAIAFFVFVVNVMRFFIIGGANEDGQKKAKALALYSVGAFVFILTFWGFVRLLTDGLGLDNDPCTRYTTSDYIDREQSPCTTASGSLVGFTDDSDIGQPVAPSAPGGGGPGMSVPAFNDGSTGNDSPTLPDGNSFTPDGDAFVADPGGQTTAERLTQSKQILRAKASDYFTDEAGLQKDFGHNSNAIRTALFADLYSASDSASVTELARLQAAYRLAQLEAIQQSTFNDYLARYNAANPTQSALTANDVRPGPQPRTAEIETNMVGGSILFIAAIQDHNSGQGVTADDMIDEGEVALLYDENIDPEARYALFETKVDEWPAVIFEVDPSLSNQPDLYLRYINDINADLILSGSYDLK